MDNGYLAGALIGITIGFIHTHLKDESGKTGKRPFMWFIVAGFLLWVLNAGLNNISRQLERQAIATEQSVKLLQEQTGMYQGWDEIMKKMLAEPPSSPKK